MSKVIRNAKGIDILIKEYLDKNNIKYELFSNEENFNNNICFIKDGFEFSVLIDDSYILATADVVNSFSDNEKALKELEEYIHRSNNFYRFAKFDYYEENLPEIRIICTSERWFSDNNITSSVIGSIESIIKMINLFAAGINKVIEGQGTAKEIFMNHQKQEDNYNE